MRGERRGHYSESSPDSGGGGVLIHGRQVRKRFRQDSHRKYRSPGTRNGSGSLRLEGRLPQCPQCGQTGTPSIRGTDSMIPILSRSALRSPRARPPNRRGRLGESPDQLEEFLQ